LLVTSLQYDSFLGKYAVGRIARGGAKKGQQVALMKRDGQVISSKIDKLFSYRGLNREEIDEAVAGDIVAITG
ncbi:MAG TPA: EF-Tu/IF-2/RF-3 family GTPase, partial [Candidatus Saccharibacteria bacterium]|nr:EF-Tu/IF-2/RF-3 family GTPase [Candidatus Saccharibacteria bacterium]